MEIQLREDSSFLFSLSSRTDEWLKKALESGELYVRESILDFARWTLCAYKQPSKEKFLGCYETSIYSSAANSEESSIVFSPNVVRPSLDFKIESKKLSVLDYYSSDLKKKIVVYLTLEAACLLRKCALRRYCLLLEKRGRSKKTLDWILKAETKKDISEKTVFLRTCCERKERAIVAMRAEDIVSTSDAFVRWYFINKGKKSGSF